MSGVSHVANNNRKTGTTFERDLCLSLAGYGFWCHNLAQNSQGQPFDVMVARNGVCYPIDCKDCASGIFRMSRIEENQYSAMTLWRSTGNRECWFALRLANGAVYMISFATMKGNMAQKTVLIEKEIRMLGVPLREWVAQCE